MTRQFIIILCILISSLSLRSQSGLGIVPGPSSIGMQKGSLNAKQLKFIQTDNPDLKPLVAYIRDELSTRKLYLEHTITKTDNNNIRFETDNNITNKEAYRLTVSPKGIVIYAGGNAGFFYGVQSLLQLIDFNTTIPCCAIEDRPAFSWRGYMVDVGRNYQSMQKLKEQINMMARYKLNVFHFHATEDIAWRFESKKYPQLNAPSNMIRNPGKFYSDAEIKELIRYCKERNILFLPEIDMPGHSAAFTRAFKTDMQSEAGTKIIKELLNEFADNYQPEYFHVGGDEVKITNKKFLPEITQLLEQRGIKTVGWSPGGNIGDRTIRQAWMGGPLDTTKGFHFVDSRHLYLNHMDPLETVATIFYRKIGDVPREDNSIKGAILCLWPDRRVEQEEDQFKMNAVYPGMIAFAERSWNGGGTDKWQSNIGEPGEEKTKAFSVFENSLLKHRDRYFSGLSFPYVKQTNLIWNLYGPYKNNGKLSGKFGPELSLDHHLAEKPFRQMIGGTIVLRHWWAPLIDGAVNEPEDSTTVYATTRIWSKEAGTRKFWIGFNDLSRSPATDSPPVGKWDEKESAVWVNGKLMAAPNWKRGSQKGNSEIPLIDEGYSYRPATLITLRKGWNNILIKAPVGSFKGRNWENPVKWMFTFIEVEK